MCSQLICVIFVTIHRVAAVFFFASFFFYFFHREKKHVSSSHTFSIKPYSIPIFGDNLRYGRPIRMQFLNQLLAAAAVAALPNSYARTSYVNGCKRTCLSLSNQFFSSFFLLTYHRMCISSFKSIYIYICFYSSQVYIYINHLLFFYQLIKFVKLKIDGFLLLLLFSSIFFFVQN